MPTGRIIRIAFVLALVTLSSVAHAQIGRRYPSEKTIVNDAVTGVPMSVLTNGQASDAKIYQTHPQWTADGKYIIFRSSGRAPGAQAYAVNEQSGEIVQLTEGAGNNTSTLNVARKSMKLYFLRGGRGGDSTTAPATRPFGGPTQLIELDLARVFADSEAGAMKAANTYERVCATLPPGMRESGGFGLDADEKFAVLGCRGGDVGEHLPAGVEVQGIPAGARMGAGPGGLRKIDLATGKIDVIIDTPFQMGHVQTNPWVPNEIIYCHETGGDAPQRIWTVLADGSGNRPVFEEGPLDWVTHETVVGKDEVMFDLIGHQQRLRVRPTGIALINLRTNAVRILGQLDESNLTRGPGGFWHCNGSADGRWAAGDTFAGNVWLIDRRDGQMTLLSTDHKMRPDHCHPTFSPSSDRILIQSGHFTDGERLSIVVLPIPSALLATTVDGRGK